MAIRRELEGIAYLGPLRRKPERDYVWNKTRPGEIGVDGSNVMNVLLASALLRSKDGEAEEIIGGVEMAQAHGDSRAAGGPSAWALVAV